MSILRRTLHKLLSGSGETMVETLVSILISSLALLMLATAIGSSINVILTSTRHIETFYSDQSALVASTNVSAGDKKTVSFGVPINKEEGKSIDIQVYENDGDSSIVLYKRDAS
ncbi:MAG: hypothetical protein J6S63_08830 [Atopobiaceae bacterium]|nr:hypothetical protein [Atopobiaceae bacterium]